MGLSLQHSLRYADKGENMLNRIVTGDESWVQHYQPESKRASMQCKHPNSPSTKKLEGYAISWEGYAHRLLGFSGGTYLLAHNQEPGENVNSASYCVVLLKLRDANRRKLPCQLARGVSPSNPGQNSRTARHWELLEHPPCSPNLAPSDFHLFGPL
jgi:histone-lysine N-methyltransferase SETMAR